MRFLRKGGRVVYGSSLENWRGRKFTVSSNLTPSASFFKKLTSFPLFFGVFFSRSSSIEIEDFSPASQAHDPIRLRGRFLFNSDTRGDLSRPHLARTLRTLRLKAIGAGPGQSALSGGPRRVPHLLGGLPPRHPPDFL